MAIRPIAEKHFLLRFSVHVCQEHYGVVDATVMPTLKEVLARFKLPEVKRKAVLTPRESPKKRLRAQLVPNRLPAKRSRITGSLIHGALLDETNPFALSIAFARTSAFQGARSVSITRSNC